MIEVSRGTDLERKLWRFQEDHEISGRFSFRLTEYHEQLRLSKRHKFHGPCWNYSDERRWNSRLDRPTEIPTDVLDEAFQIVMDKVKKATVYIGWRNPDHVYREGTQ